MGWCCCCCASLPNDEPDNLAGISSTGHGTSKPAAHEATEPTNTLNKPLVEPAKQAATDLSIDIDAQVSSVRGKLVETGDMAVAHLCYAALEHASEGITHADQKILDVIRAVPRMDLKRRREQALGFANDVVVWGQQNPIKTILMFVGLGGTAYKAKYLSQLMRRQASGYVRWSRATGRVQRFLGFVVLMIARLGVSTAVPPTSPAFGIIIQAATPESEKWTAMPFFLLSSTVAGALPYLMDKLLSLAFDEDFIFTKSMRKLTLIWPLTCWTGPAMNEVFRAAGGGKLGASLAVIVAHAAPFMGAQTTLMQRYFLPHPLDTIISQPFGMSEDLVSMALAEATSNPHLASLSLTVLVCFFNLAQFALFGHCKDWKALLTAILNLGFWMLLSFSGVEGLNAAAFQLFVQVLLIPFMARGLASLVHNEREPAPEQC